MSSPLAADARPIAHRVTGAGEAVVLLNGGLMSYPAWEPVATELARARRVVQLDFRGQLRSPGPPPPHLAGHVDDVVDLMDQLGLERAHVVGTSFGAEVGLLLAATRGSRVSSLTAVAATDHIDPAAWQAGRSFREACVAAANGGDGGRVFDILLPATFSPPFAAAQGLALADRRRAIAALPREYFRGLAGLLHSLEGMDLRDQLALIRCPTAVVAAERDLTFPLECSRALCAGIAGAELFVVEDCGHALVAEAPHRLVEILGGFLARVDKEVSS